MLASECFLNDVWLLVNHIRLFNGKMGINYFFTIFIHSKVFLGLNVVTIMVFTIFVILRKLYTCQSFFNMYVLFQVGLIFEYLCKHLKINLRVI